MYKLQPEKKSRGWIKILAITGTVALVLFACVFFVLFLPLSNMSNGSPSLRDVYYEIHLPVGNPHATCDCAEFDVTYAMPDGTAQKEVSAGNGYTDVARFRARPGEHIYLSIQNTWPSGNEARFACVIKVDRKIVAQVESVGFANIASCSGSIP